MQIKCLEFVITLLEFASLWDNGMFNKNEINRLLKRKLQCLIEERTVRESINKSLEIIKYRVHHQLKQLEKIKKDFQ